LALTSWSFSFLPSGGGLPGCRPRFLASPAAAAPEGAGAGALEVAGAGAAAVLGAAGAVLALGSFVSFGSLGFLVSFFAAGFSSCAGAASAFSGVSVGLAACFLAMVLCFRFCLEVPYEQNVATGSA